jgi:hypothetical protein
MPKVTMIKNDAVITISIGSAFLQKVQKVLVQLISDKSEEEIEDYKKAIQDVTLEELPEPWMENLLVINTLLRTIETEAVNSGHTYEKNEDDIEDINLQ